MNKTNREDGTIALIFMLIPSIMSNCRTENVKNVEVNRESTIAHDQIEDSRIHE